MRVGLSWDLPGEQAATEVWPALLAEIVAVDGLGYESAWVEESRHAAASCPSPALLLTHAARRTRTLYLHVGGRRVTRSHPVRIAEEVAVLDLFSRGRAGIGFAAAGSQDTEPQHLHEVVDFVLHAWAVDELRYRGRFVRFPSQTRDEVPEGAGVPGPGWDWVPQWERGPSRPDFLAVTPKPVATRPPVHVELSDEATLAWAARAGVSPFVGADVPTTDAVERLARFRAEAAAAGRPAWTFDPVLERRLELDGAGDDHTLGGAPTELVRCLRELRAETGCSHLVWRRSAEQLGRGDQLFRFASEVQLLLQA